MEFQPEVMAAMDFLRMIRDQFGAEDVQIQGIEMECEIMPPIVVGYPARERVDIRITYSRPCSQNPDKTQTEG